MPRPLVPDTTVFVEAIRRPELWPPLERNLRSGRIWLSSVVVAELLAGARSRDEARFIEALATSLGRRSTTARLLTPDSTDWSLAGRLIARRSRLQGMLKPRDHLADVLILVSAARVGGEVVTANLRHFSPWALLARAAGLDVTVSSAASAP